MMVLHHPIDLDLDLDLGLDLDLNLDLDFRLDDYWPNDIQLYDSTSSQWFYTIQMTFPMTLTLTLTLTLTFILTLIWTLTFFDIVTIDPMTFNYMTLQHSNFSTPSQWPWPSTLWPLTLTLTTITHHHHPPIHNTTHHHTPHSYHINVILNVNRRMKLRVIFIKRLHCPESAVIWRNTLSNNYAILFAILYIYNYKQSTYHVPPWRNGYESALQSEGPGFESRDRLKFWKSLLWHQWTQKR